ncbi:metabotropic glutamate receptor 4 [Trichonephila clavipes]|nr:metabotropic glutamate receptor 4 [Trichonephila clavipes]
MAAVDFLHHGNPPTWARVEPATLCAEGVRQTNHDAMKIMSQNWVANIETSTKKGEKKAWSQLRLLLISLRTTLDYSFTPLRERIIPVEVISKQMSLNELQNVLQVSHISFSFSPGRLLTAKMNVPFQKKMKTNVLPKDPIPHFVPIQNCSKIRNGPYCLANVVVVFSDKQVAKNVMSAAARRRAFKRFVWIGSEAWGGRQYVVEGHEEVVEGAITISPLLKPLAGFDEHFKSLTPENNAQNNPWFPEFWEEHFYCKLQDFYVTPYNQKFHKWCQEMTEPKISEANGYRQMPALHFVRDAAYAFAHALSSVHKTLCGGAPGLCERMRTMDGRMLKEAMEKVHFKDESEKTFRFLPSGDAPPRYSIINFQKKSDSNEYVWRPVGTYALAEMGLPYLDLDKNALRFKHLEMEFPRSFCSAPCHLGQAKLQLEGDTCCWLCTNCSAYQYLPDQFRCEDCPLGTLPALPDKTRCDPIPEAYLSYSNPWAIGTMAFAGMGILTTVGVAVQFWKFRDTPVIKASGRELSGLLLLGIFLSFSMTFVIVAKPAPCTCGITRFFLGFCYTLCYAAIVTKTNRIARIFNQRRLKPCQKPRYTSPKSQLIITALLVSIEAFQCNNRIVMAQRKNLEDFLRGRIIGRLECGRTQLEVSEELGIIQSVISRLWQRFQDDVTAKRNRRSTASDLSRQHSSATGTTVSRQTVYRRLRRIDLYARRPVRCVPLTATHCRLRLTWSREHALWTPQQEPGTRYHQENTIERNRFGGAGWLVWGGIILGSRTDLHVQSVTMTGHIYRDVILEQHVRLFRGTMGAEFLFMDDNARPHRANIVDECL